MAPLYKAAAAFCLVGLSWLQSGANASEQYKYQAVQVDEDAYLTVKLARNGQISAKTSSVEKDATTVSALEKKVKANEDSPKESCEALLTGDLKTVFYYSFKYTEKPDYRALVQEALNTGLEEFGTYPEEPSGWEKIWENDEVHSVLHLLGANSTKVGCVIGNCVKTSATDTPIKSVLFCQLEPAATASDAAFSEEYFKEISTRKTELKSMTEDDLKSSANAAVPSILTAGLVAILAAISA
ncbi:uncharacterized protein EMH_0078450 [Eimeria mitis]|uniref:SAG family member n=1 Tax=Eimeria mitis TaxID=44415 RepID=U6JQ61_9EIME|nr:uncharacterized protein EMH_0078450 [Eimeria mitis]CDJ26996.1 hypothetical protein EMH_0078450 [Eimeria mitis]